MYPRQGEQQQSQPQQGQRHWDQGYRGDPNQLPPNNPYGQIPISQPPHINPNRPDMAAMHPQYHHPPPQQDYRLPPPGHFYPPPQQDMYRQQPPPVTNMNQTAPRQRTAIACKYCRRRKIRCSGFENSEDGRCSNCVRFSQECIFTPVSAQTQAFVPVQAVHGRNARAGANAPQLYGSYGQPLRPQDQYHPQYQQPGYPLPSPTGGYPPHGQYMQPYPPPQQYNDPNGGRRRNKDEPHTPTLPPPTHGHHGQMGGHPEGDAPGYNYPDPTSFTNGATSPAGNPGSYPPGQAQPYYGQPQQPRRTSPGSAYSYGDPSRDSGSPYGAPPSAGYGGQGQAMPANHGQAPQTDSRTPPPHSGASDPGGNRNGMAIRDIVSENDRNPTDKDMVSALNRPSNRR